MVCAAQRSKYSTQAENHSFAEWKEFPLYALCMPIPGKHVNSRRTNHLEGCEKHLSLLLSPYFSSLKRVDRSIDSPILMAA